MCGSSSSGSALSADEPRHLDPGYAMQSRKQVKTGFVVPVFDFGEMRWRNANVASQIGQCLSWFLAVAPGSQWMFFAHEPYLTHGESHRK